MMINGRQLLPTLRFIFLPLFTHSPCRVLFVPVQGNQASQGWLTQCQIFPGCLCCLWVWSRPSLSPWVRCTGALLCTTWGPQVSHLICGKLSFFIEKMGVNIKQEMTMAAPNTFSAPKWGCLNVNVSPSLVITFIALRSIVVALQCPCKKDWGQIWGVSLLFANTNEDDNDEEEEKEDEHLLSESANHFT